MNVIVTGGGGFLGSAVVRMLCDRGDAVSVLARGTYPALEERGVRVIRHDLQQREGLEAHLAGHDAVVHTASKTGVWGPREEFFATNVDGTRNLLDAARAAGVRRFVYTSSPSATFDGRDARRATEADCSYPAHFEAPYPESKAKAEQLVLAANGQGLATVALRPHLIYGPGDPHILPRLVARRAAGRLRRVGNGDNEVGLTYIDNAAVAHLQALDALTGPDAACAGKAYFITDDGAVVLWDWIDSFLSGVGAGAVRGRVSAATAYRVGAVLEWVWRTLGLGGEPPMTRFVAKELATSHSYDLTAARRDLGYTPLVDGDEGLRRAIAAFRV